MDRYKTLKAVQGLLISLDEQIYRLDTVKKEIASDKTYDLVIDKYYEAIIELLTKKEDNAKS